MPYFALDDGVIVKPSQVEDGAELECRRCGGRMGVWSSHTNRHGHFVSRHFKHIGDSGGCGGGESDPHVEMKEVALHKLQWEVETNLGVGCQEITTERKVGQSGMDYHIADVFCEFEEPRFPHGRGIIVEVQFKNEQKKVDAVSEYYLRHGYSVYWVWPEQFDNRDVDLRGGDVRMVWPHAVAAYRKASKNGEKEVSAHLEALRLQISNSSEYDQVTSVPATLPSAYFDQVALELWRGVPWNDLLHPPTQYIPTSGRARVPAIFPVEWITDRSSRTAAEVRRRLSSAYERAKRRRARQERREAIARNRSGTQRATSRVRAGAESQQIHRHRTFEYEPHRNAGIRPDPNGECIASNSKEWCQGPNSELKTYQCWECHLTATESN